MRGAILAAAGTSALVRNVVANGVANRDPVYRPQEKMAGKVFARDLSVDASPRDATSETTATVAELTAALEAKNLLLREVDHRVKNSLGMIGALLRIQASTIADPAIAATLGSMLERVDAIATVHRRLYQSDDDGHFDVSALAEELARDVIGASGRTDIAMLVGVEPLLISPSKASSMGLILNELTTNAVKHGFADGRPGTLTITGRSEGHSGILELRDDGAGMTNAARDRPPGMGRMLVDRLSRHAHVDVAWFDAHPGTNVRLSFPVVS